jgi:hypothetical protein
MIELSTTVDQILMLNKTIKEAYLTAVAIPVTTFTAT